MPCEKKKGKQRYVHQNMFSRLGLKLESLKLHKGGRSLQAYKATHASQNSNTSYFPIDFFSRGTFIYLLEN